MLAHKVPQPPFRPTLSQRAGNITADWSGKSRDPLINRQTKALARTLMKTRIKRFMYQRLQTPTEKSITILRSNRTLRSLRKNYQPQFLSPRLALKMKDLSSLRSNLRRMLLLRPLNIRKIRLKLTERLVSMKTSQLLILFQLLSTTTVVMKMFSS